MPQAARNTRIQKLRRQARVFPRQFWLLIAGTFVYLLVTSFAFPFTAILLRQRLVRLMIGAGEVVGPLVAAGLLAARCPLPVLFALAGAGCLAFLVFTLVALRETRPAHAAGRRTPAAYETDGTQALGSAVSIPVAEPRRRRRAAAPSGGGYGRVLADRRFLAFWGISLLPLFIFGQMYASFLVLVTGTLHVRPSTWGLLMSFMAVVVVLTQYPGIRLVKRFDPMFQIAMASARFGLGVGLTAFVPGGALLLLTMATLALAQALFGPVSSSIVAGMADVEVRGRYMGAWTLIWSAGQQAIGPMLGGVLFDRLGAHGSYGLIIAVGLAGACLYPWLRGGRVTVATPAGESLPA